MFSAAYTNANGIAVQDVDMGVEYSKGGKTVSIIGEQDSGEIHLNSVFVGYYEQDEDGNVTVTDAKGTVIAVLDYSEEAFEEFAATLLA
jgi:ABC-type polysaccharide/polyol phosphate transport system ATPase subunit